MDFDSAADELYASPREEFIASRDAAVREARGKGDRELADRIGALRKPTVAAWLVNRLVREHRDEVRELAKLGDRFRDPKTTLSGDELRTLNRRRGELIRDLTDRARSIGRKAGHAVGDNTERDVTSMLQAALSDPDAADTVLLGRLFGTLEADAPDLWLTAGVQPAAKRKPKAEPAKPTRKAKEPPPEKPARRRSDTAKRDRQAEARERLRAEQAAAKAAEKELASAERRARAASDKVTTLQEQLNEANREARKARADMVSAHQNVESARRAVERAGKRLSELD